jgi:hypothetical protein
MWTPGDALAEGLLKHRSPEGSQSATAAISVVNRFDSVVKRYAAEGFIFFGYASTGDPIDQPTPWELPE